MRCGRAWVLCAVGPLLVSTQSGRRRGRCNVPEFGRGLEEEDEAPVVCRGEFGPPGFADHVCVPEAAVAGLDLCARLDVLGRDRGARLPVCELVSASPRAQARERGCAHRVDDDPVACADRVAVPLECHRLSRSRARGEEKGQGDESGQGDVDVAARRPATVLSLSDSQA